LTDKLGEDIQARLEEETEKMMTALEEAQKKNKKKKEPLPDKASLNPRLPDDIVSQILKKKLTDNLYRNRGYILDGYPRGYNDAMLTYYEVDAEKPEDSPDRLVLQTEILPNSVIRLEGASDEFLKARIKEIPDINPSDPHLGDEAMTRRLQNYKNLNESIKGEPALSDFFFKNKVSVLGIDCKLNENELVNKAKIFFERNGIIVNYQKFDEEDEKIHKQNFKSKLEKNAKIEELEMKE
jgi:adenylate kinase